MSKTLGVLGGMGPAATLDFLAKLQAATPVSREQDHLRVLVDINPKVPDRNDSYDAAGPVLAEMAVGLREAGAQVLAIACNTAHAYVDQVKASGLPLVDLIETAGLAAKAQGARARRRAGHRRGPGPLSPDLLAPGDRGRDAGRPRTGRVHGPALSHQARRPRRRQPPDHGRPRPPPGRQGRARGGGRLHRGPAGDGPADLAVPFIDATQALARRCVEVCLASE
jgi:aspartate racemase